MALSDKDSFELMRAAKDCAAKVAALPDRIRDEFQQAEAENREPLPIEPLTETRGRIVLHAIEQIKDASPELSDIIGVQRKSCAIHANDRIYLLSTQLKMILDAAGLGEKTPDAQVQG